ncbi:MAG: hypothetical protein JW891_02010 [Candidatus Lokiarchaeota archaeon]|nr:hypothetical protein [Candidatus Lokiarchaeota archaeon]
MRKSRIVKLILTIVLLFFTLSLSIVSVLAGISAVNILGNPNNVQLVGAPDPDFSDSNPNNWQVSIQFYINNDGYFDLTRLSFSLSMSYYNGSSEGTEILSVSQNYPNIPSGRDLLTWFNITGVEVPSGFIVTSGMQFKGDMTLSGRYSLDMLEFRAVFTNQTIYEVP